MQKYGDIHPNLKKYQEKLVMLMEKFLTHLSFVQVNYFQTLVSNLKPSINQVSFSLLQKKLIT